MIARVEGAPTNYTIKVDGNDVLLTAVPEPELSGLLASSVNGIGVGTPAALAVTLPSKLRELIVIVNYTLTS